MTASTTPVSTDNAALEQTIVDLRAKIAAQVIEREELLAKLEAKEKGGVTKRTLKVTKNVVGVTGLAVVATTVVVEAIGFAATKLAGADYEFGSSMKALLKLSAEKTTT